jgi:3-mercaptopyruvate sulfurtransferase SseA
MSKWQADALPVTKDATPLPKPGSFRITKVNEESRARMREFVAASGDRPGKVLVDALGPEYHYGASAFFNKSGHIPHAVLLPSEDLFNADKTFKSPAEIRRMLAYLSIRPEQEIHSHCGGGGAAAVPYFALKHLVGYPDVKLSLESQMGWLQDDRDLPFWTYAAPGMVRETDWLGSWGGKMMRMYGMSRVSVVDVRTGAAYGQGHVPFALNVPADAFRSNIADPAKLAEILGASGVNPAHEAVVVSGGGLTKESALAFVMLEKMGQKKVSVFMDSLDSVESLDKMARRGFAVTKEPTKVAPASYTVIAREGVTVADAKGSGGTYPKVFIASGAVAPAKAPDGKVVHVPYTQLLKADGTPKEAKDIWTILTKAGVPRYAELVTFSEDPGEAAVNYFVLKLMGFPDAKMLVN